MTETIPKQLYIPIEGSVTLNHAERLLKDVWLGYGVNSLVFELKGNRLYSFPKRKA